MKLAYLFPGQGAQTVGMGKALADKYSEAREVFERADEVLGFPLSKICWEGPEEELRKTVHTQPALLVHSMAALRVWETKLEEKGLERELGPSWTAGHSLGEYSACVAADALKFEDALELVHKRGRWMYEAGLERHGSMAALLAEHAPQVAEKLCVLVQQEMKELGDVDFVIVTANFNSPTQVVISGTYKAIQVALKLAKQLDVKRAVPLEVSGAFHSPLMEPAAHKLEVELERTTFHTPRCRVVCNVNAEELEDPGAIKQALKRQVRNPVRWKESMDALVPQAEGFLELGTGTVLRGLLRGIDRKARSWNVADPASLDEAVNGLRDAQFAGNA